MTLNEIIENFKFLEDWESRYGYLIDLGKNMAPMPKSDHTEENKVHGCTSQVWLTHKIEGDIFTFCMDSDAHFVRGLCAILCVAYTGKTAAQILEIDIEKAFKNMDLAENLSPNRRNGFVAMVTRIHNIAKANA